MHGRNAGVLAVAILALAAGPSVSAGVQSSQAGWYAGNPLLGANDLEDVACAGVTCYASGAFGTLMRSDDGGAAWTGIVTGVTSELGRVRVAGGDPGKVVAGGGCDLLRSDDGGAHVRRLDFAGRGACPSAIAGISFPTSDDGFVLSADGALRATHDGGRTWARKSSVRSRAPAGGGLSTPANDLLCTSVSDCFAAAGNGVLAHTTDGGGSWSEAVRADTSLNAIAFADERTGYVAGAGVLLKTTDGGESWQRQDVGAELTSAGCDPGTCLFATRAGDEVFRSADGGQTLEPVDASVDSVYGVGFASPSRALAVGAGASAAVSDDTGTSWSGVGGRLFGRLLVLRAAAAGVAFAGGSGGLLASTHDAGASWQSLQPGTRMPIRDVVSADGGTTVYVLDAAGGLTRSGDGGVSWAALATGARRPLALLAPAGGDLVLIGRRALALSRDGGRSFFAAVEPKLSRHESLSSGDRAQGALFAYGPHTLLRSADGGRMWRRLKLPRLAAHESLARADFLGPRYGYLLTSRRRLFKTTRAGGAWTTLLATGGAGADLAFSDPSHGWVAAPGFAYRYDGVVIATSDGGASWRPQIVGRGFLRGLSADGSTGYALTGDNALNATRSGGDAGAPSRLTLRPSARTLARGRRLIVRGRLVPAGSGRHVVVSAYAKGRWIARVVAVGASGTWTSTWKLTRTTTFVAQALGDAAAGGAGTRAVRVRVRVAHPART